MKAKTGPNQLRAIVDLAKSLGELGHRRFLIQEELKSLRLQAREDSAFQKSKTGNTPRVADHKRALQDHVEYLTRMQCLVEEEEELAQIERLAEEVERLMKETVGSLLERIRS